MEANFVVWLNGQPCTWTYEQIKIEYDEGFHIPDFQIKFRRQKWVVELKGFYRPDHGNRIVKKVMSTIQECAKHEYSYTVLSAKDVGTKGKHCNRREWVDLTKLTKRKIYAFLKRKIPGANSNAFNSLCT